ncbi:hypothetical protein [Deinococcus sp. Leaf326]|jgi:hypothetical protein|uniref:hypothetical protein n=1 Tax=Deinococcus sp. Leaf326 TaxID=1736338 RepID=UPI0006FF2C34|nr:hypothetical protein [Deinococcus sp. Leaf326]KQQ99095.1 hypothetical protein ASF71_21955 [Deinococcus sp. Leaf326]
MLPSEQLGKWRQVLGATDAELWATTRTVDSLRSGPTAATQLVLLNTGPVALYIRDIEVKGLIGGAFFWDRPGVVEPEDSWTVLDKRSFDVLMGMTRQAGRRGFGMQGIVHEVVIHLDRPKPRQLDFQVSWGFATPEYDMGFFVSAHGDSEGRDER